MKCSGSHIFFPFKHFDLAYKRSQSVTFRDFPALGTGFYFSWQHSYLKAVYLTLLSGFNLKQRKQHYTHAPCSLPNYELKS